jgi:8-amino-7-oxononanoate synthase
MHDPLEWIDAEADAWSLRGLERRLVALGKATPGRVVGEGRSLRNFASNDYLGLASDVRVIEAACLAAVRYGWGAGASPLVSGWREPHEKLAASLTEFEGVEAVALFSSGYAANLGTIAALAGPGDVAYLDRLNHACLVDGVRLSRARLRVYPHADADRLDELLARDRGKFRRSLIATDGVFSMDGDLAPLRRLSEIAERYGAMLLVDEAHGTGVYGGGRGASVHCGVADRVHVRVGTLSKALGSVGGFVAGSRRLVDWLVNRARTLVYSTGLPPSAAAAAGRALEIIQAEPDRRDRLYDLSMELRARLTDLGVPDIELGGPIVPVIVGDPAEAVRLSARLLEAGCLVPAIRPPTVPEGTARLRISLTAAHEPADVAHLIAALVDAGPALGAAL